MAQIFYELKMSKMKGPFKKNNNIDAKYYQHSYFLHSNDFNVIQKEAIP